MPLQSHNYRFPDIEVVNKLSLYLAADVYSGEQNVKFRDAPPHLTAHHLSDAVGNDIWIILLEAHLFQWVGCISTQSANLKQVLKWYITPYQVVLQRLKKSIH